MLGNALDVLNVQLTRGTLSSTLEAYLEDMRHDEKTSYARVLAEDGKDAAEAELSALATRLHLREFSSAIEPVVRGMRDLAATDAEGKHVMVLPITKHTRFVYPYDGQHGSTGHLVVAFNPSHRGCGCTVPEGHEVFGEHGALPLRAAVLGLLDDKDPTLVLVFPLRPGQLSAQGYTAIEIKRHGFVDGTTVGAEISARHVLGYSLGIISADQTIGRPMISGGSLDERLGFPGGGDYLAKHIHELGPYLSGTAAHLGDHKH